MRRPVWQTAVKLLLLALYIFIALLHIEDYTWNYDEGVLLQTAALSHQGYPLFSETVINKPPLLIWWVQLSFLLGGIGVVPARLAVLLLTAVLLWLLGLLAKAWWGEWADIVAMAGYLLLPETLVRASVVMNNLPALLFMVAALYTATRFYRVSQVAARVTNPLRRWAILTGLFYGLGVGMHPLLVYMVLPIALLLSWHTIQRWDWLKWLRVGLLAGGTAVLTTLSWLVWIDWASFWEWVVVFNRLPLDPTLQAKADRNLLNLAKAQWEYGFLLLPALASCILLWRQADTSQKLFLWVTAVWYLITLLILWTLQPMWLHYTFFIFIPILLVFSGGLAQSLGQSLARNWGQGQQQETAVSPLMRRILWGLSTLFLLFGLVTPREWVSWQPEQQQTLAFLQETVSSGSFAISDDPYLLFAANIYVPPPLTDSSTKRISTQLLTTAHIVQTGWQYGVTEYVLTNGRFHQLPSLFQWLDAFAEPVATFGEISIVQIAPLPQPTSNIEATFNDAILLEQAAITTSLDGADMVIDGTFFWKTAVSLPADYKFFIHILDEAGELVGQFDGSPQAGWLPTSQWIPQQPVIDAWQLRFSPTDPQQTYTITTGLYTWPDVQRLPARLSSGEPALNHAVPVGEIKFP